MSALSLMMFITSATSAMTPATAINAQTQGGSVSRDPAAKPPDPPSSFPDPDEAAATKIPKNQSFLLFQADRKECDMISVAFMGASSGPRPARVLYPCNSFLRYS